MNKLIPLLKKEAILFIAALLALLSMIAVPPDARYGSYIDYSVLGLLFCLMAAVAGLKNSGLFDSLSQRLLVRVHTVKFLTAVLASCVFVCSMFMTNDVALLTFVPITLGIFARVDRKKLIFAIVMETLAANMGSMLTPIGNPQNLFIYSFYRLNILRFFEYVLPIGVISYLVIMGLILVFQNGAMDAPRPKIETGIAKKQIDAVRNALSLFLEGRVFIVSVLGSQVISNVPAAMMLSRFTTDARQLLLGVNIGGLGTPIASLASLISFRLYSQSEGAAPGKFFKVFTVYNVALLLVLCAIFLL
ncbi:MAG: SLC13 family permease [Clostridiales bacterium]|nr:SLC13 family permease [Clostridiales bacterium]